LCCCLRLGTLLSRPAAAPAVAPLSLRDALPICFSSCSPSGSGSSSPPPGPPPPPPGLMCRRKSCTLARNSAESSSGGTAWCWWRSEEHTSELQSRFDLVCRLLLEQKKNREKTDH